MQYCDRCRMDIRGYKRCCPLCGSTLIGEGEDPCFPTIPRKRMTYLLLQKICFFVLFVLVVATVLISKIIGDWMPWMWLVILTGVVVCADVFLMKEYRRNVLKTLHLQVYVGMLLCLLVDHYTGKHGWAMEWVVPIAFVLIMAATIVFALILKIALKDFTLYLASDVVMALLQLIPIYLDKNDYPIPAECSIALVLIAYGALVIFGWKAFHTATSRFFNV